MRKSVLFGIRLTTSISFAMRPFPAANLRVAIWRLIWNCRQRGQTAGRSKSAGVNRAVIKLQSWVSALRRRKRVVTGPTAAGMADDSAGRLPAQCATARSRTVAQRNWRRVWSVSFSDRFRKSSPERSYSKAPLAGLAGANDGRIGRKTA